jgi:trigger factor
VKSDLETLNPTRVKLTVEVPFDELKPSLDAAYKKIAGQVNIPGFRRGKVPPRVIDQRFGRSVVLEEAVNDALPRFYGQAVEENSLQVLGQPEVEVTELEDGQHLRFTVEVDKRPEFDLPDYDGLEVTVDNADVDDAAVDEQVDGLRERFSTLKGVDRPVTDGDFASIDLSATVDGEAIEDLTAKGLSYQAGQGSLLDGLDEAIVGLAAGESKEFPTSLVGGDHAGKEAVVTVTVNSVKERELPEVDDDFAQTASEFDTIDELRGDIAKRMRRIKTLTQGVQARDKVLETLLDRVEVPIPEHVLDDEVTYRLNQMDSQLEAAGLTKENYAEAQEQTPEQIDQEIKDNAAGAIKAQFVLDAIAKKEELSVDESDLTEQIVRRAQQAGVPADQYAQQVVNAGQLGALMADILRGKALALVLERAKITDASGNEVVLDAITGGGEDADE